MPDAAVALVKSQEGIKSQESQEVGAALTRWLVLRVAALVLNHRKKRSWW
jgi:hypothetical protein